MYNNSTSIYLNIINLVLFERYSFAYTFYTII